MKQLVASRKLKRKCIKCEKGFNKGEVYYKERKVFEEDGKVYAHEYLICPRCVQKETSRKERYKEFKETCKHPKEFVQMEYSYMPGECVMQPERDVCTLCSKTL